MNDINFNNILKKQRIETNIKQFLINFENNKNDLSINRGIYLYGAPGSGKTLFIHNLLISLDYDIICYNSGDIRNKSIIDTICQYNITNINVHSLLTKKTKKIAIIMDEIDGMNNGDKGGINSLIKLIRPKKTKKQKKEEICYIPIICISNYHVDKKIKELMKVCLTCEFNSPTDNQLLEIIKIAMPKLDNIIILNQIIKYIQNDLRKLFTIYKIYNTNISLLHNHKILEIFQHKSVCNDTKHITRKLINNKYSISDHTVLMNETDRTIVGLLWHENIIEVINRIDKIKGILLYIYLLHNICYADNIDRITFQKQIWQFNEMSSLVKILYNNNILHDTLLTHISFPLLDIRFTKVLTKYSTEYNNYLFIQNLCQILHLDKKDLISYFVKLSKSFSIEYIYSIFDHYEITKLDINRLYRYIEKYTVNNNICDSNEAIDIMDTEPLTETAIETNTEPIIDAYIQSQELNTPIKLKKVPKKKKSKIVEYN